MFLAPEDGKAIESFENRDEIWTKVVKEIRGAVEGVTLEKEKKKEELNIGLIENFEKELNSSEINFFHKNKDSLSLDDFFVYPDLKKIKDEYNSLEQTINASEVILEGNKDAKVLVMGEEQTGKSTLSKMIYKKILATGFLPILLNGSEISEIQSEKILSNAIKNQYSNLDYEKFIKSSKNKAVLIDDFHLIRLNKKFQKKFLENMEMIFGVIIVFGDKLLQFYEAEYLIFSNYVQYEILNFGHVKRGELIQKWNSIGEIETISDEELEAKIDSLTRNIDQIIRGNIVPPKPIYILTIIQTLEANKRNDYSLTSYGHCYHTLILFALNKQKIKSEEYDTYLNYLRELAFWIFKNDVNNISEEEVQKFETNYSAEYVVASHQESQKTLLKASILENRNGKLGFRYKYLFYFFVAKYLSDRNEDPSCIGVLENLCKNIHRERNANILIFLVHHSKKRNIIDEILLNTMCIFDGISEEGLLVKDLKFLTDINEAIPKLVIERRDVEKERVKRLEARDAIDNQKEVIANGESAERMENEKDIFGDTVKSAKAVEIVGQILRNYHGSLKREDLQNLSSQAIKVGLRFLRFYLNAMESSKEQLLEVLKNVMFENTNMKEEEIIDEAKKIFLTLSYQVSMAVVWKISNSLGEDKLIELYEGVYKGLGNTPAVRLIDLIIKLEYTNGIPRKEIYELSKDLEKANPFAFRIAQDVLVHHLYLHHMDHKDRQWISDILKIPVATQLLIDEKKTQKLIN